MPEELEYTIQDIRDQPWVLYKVITAHGSKFDIYFRHTLNLLSKQDPEKVLDCGGYLYVEGLSESTGKRVRLGGFGSRPEVDATVGVEIIGVRPDGTHILKEELIKQIVSIQEVGKDLPQ